MQVNYKVSVDWFSLMHYLRKSRLSTCSCVRSCLFGQIFSLRMQVLISKSLDWFQLNLLLEAYTKYYKVKLFLKWQDLCLTYTHQVTACDVCSFLRIYAVLYVVVLNKIGPCFKININIGIKRKPPKTCINICIYPKTKLSYLVLFVGLHSR
jgi:hypothetical protein